MPGIHPLERKAVSLEAAQEAISRTQDKGTAELDRLLASLAEKVADVRAALASAKDNGAEGLGHHLDGIVQGTRKGVDALDRRWRRMDKPQRIALAGGLLAALAAAAAAPTVVRRIRARS